MRNTFIALMALTTSALAQPVSLFDGKSLDGWDFDPKLWKLEEREIRGGSLTEKVTHNDFIATKKHYSNFELRVKLRLSGTGFVNSGVQIRSLRVPGTPEMCGFQVDYGKGWYGKIYDEGRRNRVVAEAADLKACDAAIKEGEWNEYRIRAEGARIQSWINGVPALDYTEADPNVPQDGIIGVQIHGGGAAQVQVKDITIEELPATPNAPTWEKLGGVEGVRKLVAPPKKQADAAKPAKRDISYNDVKGTALTAEEEQKKFHLPEGYEIELVAKESEGIGKFVSVYFDQRGRMWTQTALEYPVDANENPAAAEAVYANKGKDKVLVYPREALNATLPAGGLTNPTVFADGLAIPLGMLPWGNGDTCYIQHGHDLKLFKDTNGDGKADKFDIVLTGFGVQDSHLFPHQFTRAPGGWIWMAQGLFNMSKVRKPGEPEDKAVDWPKCSMARMRPDGAQFEVTSVGPNNIWGLVITGEGETFIQEANDYGYPVMPFQEYTYYPGGMESYRKSYQPELPPQTDVRMGGTGLSGLALGEGEFRKLTPTVKDDGLCMFVANPITSKIQTIAMHREDSRKNPQQAPNGWRLEMVQDLITCDDPFFRPVGMTNGPDGCIYITDWYNKIISHNEVPRAHPDRDKTRGRIWRVKPRSVVPALAGQKSTEPAKAGTTKQIPDFTKLSTDELIALLGTQPTARAHLAWQTLIDRNLNELMWKLRAVASSSENKSAIRIQALWALDRPDAFGGADCELLIPLLTDSDENLRREAVSVMSGGIRVSYSDTDRGSFDCELRTPGNYSSHPPHSHKLLTHLESLVGDSNPSVRHELILAAARAVLLCESFIQGPSGRQLSSSTRELALKTQRGFLTFFAGMAKPSLPGPTIQSSRGPKQVPTGEAYDREFERYLVRMFLERHPDVVAKFLDTPEAAKLPIEARVLASLALEPKASASRVAKLLPQLERAPNDEELLRLAQFPEEAGCGDALKSLLSNAKSRAVVAEKLLAQKTKLDPKKIAPLLSEAGKALLGGKDDERALGVSLIGGFQLASLEDDLVAMTRKGDLQSPASVENRRSLVLALRELRSGATDLFVELVKTGPASLRDDALAALSASKNPNAAEHLFTLYPTLTASQQRAALNALSASKPGAKAIVAALSSKRIPTTDLDGPTAERLSLVLGNDPELTKLMASLGHVFHDVLAFDGSDDAWIDSHITLDGPFTVETWIKLAEGIGNEDDILGVPGGVEMNFFQSKFRVFAGPALHDVAVAKKPMTPDLWTHIAVTRDAKGIIKIYQNGELDAVSTKPVPDKWENCRIGWSGPKKGTEGMMTEFRIWKTERTAQEIRTNFDRVLNAGSKLEREMWIKAIGDIVMTPSDPRQQGTLVVAKGKPNPPRQGARLAKTIDTPPLLTTEQAAKLDKQFAHYSELGRKSGNIANGKMISTLCLACHTIGATGGQIGPNLSGAGAMGLEGVLRNIMTPNAAMESGYRIFRVELKSGDIVDALFVSEDKQAFVIRQPGLQDRRIDKKDVRSTRFIRRSLMPEGLLDALNDTQVTDLLSYLMTLKG